ncbi:MAG: zinc ribbon domain-containing protein [Thermoanaerobacteraceae bacterium]|nr:zinc ribbon domain-containing protein [Thermoanaerobacteraceae bacterium]
MPLYEYHCKDCDNVFEMLVNFSESNKKVKCPECESENTEKLISGFASCGSDSGFSDAGCG